ncbi:MAG: DUF362 domain-containing protein [Thermodesulfobacteriota bacterium]
MTCDRRTFLKWQAAAAVSVAGSCALGAWPAGAADAPDLAIIKGGPEAATRAAVQALGGMKRFVSSGQTVLIKPNMSFDNPPEMATTTHPVVISTLVAMCREAGAERVWVRDHTLRGVEECLEHSGIREACQPLSGSDVRGVNVPDGFVQTSIPGAEHYTSTAFMREARDADVLIAAPVAKHHGSTGVSLSMKGMMGLIYNRGELHWRYNLHTSIADLMRLARADLTVVDVTRALTTNGPSGPGEVQQMDTIVASTDMVAADAQVVSMVPWYGREMAPEKVEHIRVAHEWGLGRMDVENLQVYKDSV